MPNIGEPAPDFVLPNQNGVPVRLSDLRGKKVVLFAYPKADTPGCNAQACGFRDEFPQIQTTNAVVLGISPDKPKDLLEWKQKRNLPYDLLSDPRHKVLDEWGVWGTGLLGIVKLPITRRSYWVIDEHGIIIDGQVGVGPVESVAKALQALGQSTARAT